MYHKVQFRTAGVTDTYSLTSISSCET